MLRPPSNNQPLWRYVDFERLADLLTRKKLYFPRADLLGDPFEGTLPKLDVTARARLAEKMQKNMPLLPGFGDWFLKDSIQYVGHHREWTFISCWHMAIHESAAMWDRYGRAAAIRTDYGRLLSALSSYPMITVVPIEYIDFDVQGVDAFSGGGHLFMYKRVEFQDERELRCIWFSQEEFNDFSWYGPFDFPLDLGRSVPVDPNQLIEAIVLAPGLPRWKGEVISDVCRRLGFSGSIRSSSLDSSPDL